MGAYSAWAIVAFSDTVEGKVPALKKVVFQWERERDSNQPNKCNIVSKCHQEKIKQFKVIKGPRSAILERMIWEVVSEEVTLSRDMIEVGINHEEN